MEILQLTSAHFRDDIRIFKKISKSLSKKYKVTLLVADGKPAEKITKNLKIISVTKPKNRFQRFVKTPFQFLIKILRYHKNKIVHVHDPELIHIALILKLFSFKIVFDSHEDLPKQILSKPYLNEILKKPISLLVAIYELITIRYFNLIICATDSINHSLKKYNSNSFTINNYPIIEDLKIIKKDRFSLVYVGAISEIRGIKELVEALSYSKKISTLNLVGSFNSKNLYSEVSRVSGWEKVKFHGQLSREKARQIIAKSQIGIVTFLPKPNHVNSQPNKLFEYMEIGLPVIISNFKKWNLILDKYNCGCAADPTNPKEIAKTIDKLLVNDELIKKMSFNSRNAILENYSWDSEEIKLFNLYKNHI